MKTRLNLRKYIVILVILLLAYFTVDYIPYSNSYKKRQSRDIEISENIKTLRDTTGELESLIQADKDALNDFFYNDKTYGKIDGIIKANPSNIKLKINDNLIVVLKKEGYPVGIMYKRASFDLIDSRVGLAEDKNMAMVKDVRVIENPNAINDYELIHDLKTYLVDAYGQAAFDSYLDKFIENQIDENMRLIDKISKSTVNTSNIERRDGK